MRTTIIKAVCYPLFFLVCLVFFLFQSFPVELIAQKYARRAQQKMGMKLTYRDITTLFPNGIEATGLSLVKEGKVGEAPIMLDAEQASARISLFGLLASNYDVSFDVDLLAGKAEGDYRLSDGKSKLKAQLSALNLARAGFLPDAIGQEIVGKLSGSIKLDVDPKDIKKTTGEINIDLTEGQVGNRKAYFEGVILPWIDLGKTEANLTIQKGKAEIKSCTVKSEDIDLSVDGYFLLQQNLTHTTSHLRVRFKPSEELMQRIKKQIPPEFHGMMDNALNKAKGTDGYYRYSIFGRIFGGKPQIRPLKQ